MKSQPVPTLFESTVLIGICFGWFIVSSFNAVSAGFPDSGRFDDASLLGLVAVEIVLGGTAFLFLFSRGYQVLTLLPKPSWLGSLVGVFLFVFTWILCSLVSGLFAEEQLRIQPIVKIVAMSAPSLGVVVLASAINGLFEEIFLVGYLVKGFAASGAPFAIGLSLLVRILYHLYQGPIGTVSILVFGLAVSLFYWRTRTLWPVVLAHVLTDVFALA